MAPATPVLHKVTDDQKFLQLFKKTYMGLRKLDYKSKTKRGEIRKAAGVRRKLMLGKTVPDTHLAALASSSGGKDNDVKLRKKMMKQFMTETPAGPDAGSGKGQGCPDYIRTSLATTKGESAKLAAEQSSNSVDNYCHRLNMCKKIILDALSSTNATKLQSKLAKSVGDKVAKKFLTMVRRATASAAAHDSMLHKLVFTQSQAALQTLQLMKCQRKIKGSTMSNILSAFSACIQCNRWLGRDMTGRAKTVATLVNNCAMQKVAELRKSLQKSAAKAAHTTMNVIPKKAKDNYVSLSEIKSKWRELRDRTLRAFVTLMSGHERKGKGKCAMSTQKLVQLCNSLLLMSLYTHLPPKRADCGNIRLHIDKSLIQDCQSAFVKGAPRFAGNTARPVPPAARSSKSKKGQVKQSKADNVAAHMYELCIKHNKHARTDAQKLDVCRGVVQNLSALPASVRSTKSQAQELKFDKTALPVSKQQNTNSLFISDLNHGSFIKLSKYKTAQKYNNFIERLPVNLRDDVLMVSMLLPQRTHLITNSKTHTGYTTNNSYTQSVIRTFKREFKRRVGCTMLRHIYVTEKVKPSRMSVLEQKNVADRMLHTHAQQQEYRWMSR